MRPVSLERLLVTFLRGALNVHVGTKVPTTRPPAFIRLTRTGGPRRNLIQADGRVLVECWASKDTDAEDLASNAYAALDSLDTDPGGLPFMALDLTDPVNFPDTQSGSPRYQFIATITANLQE